MGVRRSQRSGGIIVVENLTVPGPRAATCSRGVGTGEQSGNPVTVIAIFKMADGDSAPRCRVVVHRTEARPQNSSTEARRCRNSRHSALLACIPLQLSPSIDLDADRNAACSTLMCPDVLLPANDGAKRRSVKHGGRARYTCARCYSLSAGNEIIIERP